MIKNKARKTDYENKTKISVEVGIALVILLLVVRAL
jgi:hypothetical protein